MFLSCSLCNARRRYCDRICSIRSISTKTQHFPILAPGTSPALALASSVTGWIFSSAAACCRVSVSIPLASQIDRSHLLALVPEFTRDREPSFLIDDLLLGRQLPTGRPT